jgi:molecular chaperone Hsp33
MDDTRSDELFAGTTEDGAVTVVGGITTSLVREIAMRHKMSPLAAVATARLATGATLIGAGLKGSERISLQVFGDGPLGSLVAEVSQLDGETIGTRAYAKYDQVDLPRNTVGGVDVRHGIGRGRLQVTKSFAIGQPFVGIVGLQSGEIDDDLAAYFVQSQQIPGIVQLGVHEQEGEVLAAGGLIAQVMPSADEWVYADLELRSRAMPDIAHQLRVGATAEQLVRNLVGNQSLHAVHSFRVQFHCRCTRERVEAALLSLGREDLERLAAEQPITEATCEYCRRIYELSSEEVRDLAARLGEP